MRISNHIARSCHKGFVLYPILFCFQVVFVFCNSPQNVSISDTRTDEIEFGSRVRYSINGACDDNSYFSGQRQIIKEHWEHGKIVTQYFKQGKLHGTEKIVTKKEILLRDYMGGKLHGKRLLYLKDNTLVESDTYEEGHKHGVSKRWYPNGNPEFLITFSKGARDGRFYSWWENGSTKIKAMYMNGKLKGPVWYWDKNGLLIWSGQYCDDTLCGEWKRYDTMGQSKNATLIEVENSGMVILGKRPKPKNRETSKDSFACIHDGPGSKARSEKLLKEMRDPLTCGDPWKNPSWKMDFPPAPDK